MQESTRLTFLGRPKAEELARLRRLVVATSRLSHPNLCRVRGLVEKANEVAVESDAVEGESLAEHVQKLGPLSTERVRALAHDLCAGLELAHRNRLVHGQLTAREIWVASDRFLVDGIGLVQAAQADRLDERVDVRGVGLVLYVALTGKMPFEVSADELPSGLRAPILRCLQQDPARRFGSIAELALALKVTPEAARPRARRVATVACVCVVAAVVALSLLVVWRGHHANPSAAVAVASVIAPSASATTARKLVVGLSGFSPQLSPRQSVLPRGLGELFITALASVPSTEVVVLPSGIDPSRAPNVDLALDLAVEPQDSGLSVQVKVWDVENRALRLAERAALRTPADLLGVADSIWTKLRPSLGKDAPDGPLHDRFTRIPSAIEPYILGLIAMEEGDGKTAETEFRRAIVADPNFFQPLVPLLALLSAQHRDPEMPALAALAGKLAKPVGQWGQLRLSHVLAKTNDEKLGALESLRVHAPHDLGIATELTVVYRQLGRFADCVSEARRAITLGASKDVLADLAVCSLEAGDENGALEAARSLERDGQSEILGDVLLRLSRYGEARDAYQRAVGASARANLVWLDVWSTGRCAELWRQSDYLLQGEGDDSEMLVGTVGLAAAYCGDFAMARQAQARLLGRSGLSRSAVANALTVLLDWKYQSARARWQATDRAVFLAPLIRAARKEGKSSDVLELVGQPTPTDRYAFHSFPVLFEIALAQVEVGDVEDAALSCEELFAAAPHFAPARFCAGRAAEARKDWSDAFRHYRAFLDDWSDAEANPLVVEAKRRLGSVITQARTQ